ncbi:MAG TPA: hypothetical protein VGH27_00530 [Streptosporangiaceae bacterium]|jgi:aryl-alcohol dehydrogenase-like predicted oxidoreductase
MPAHDIDAAASGTWMLGDLSVNRIGFGAKRLTSDFDVASDRDTAIALLRRATEFN